MPPRAGAKGRAAPHPIDPLVTQLKKTRTDKHVSIVQLATILGVSKATVASWERGHRQVSLYWLRRWAAALDLTPELRPIGTQGQTT